MVWESAGIALQAKEILFLALGLGGVGSSVAMTTFFQELPLVYPLILGIVSLAGLGYAFFRARANYNLYIKVLNQRDTTIERILKLLLDMHLELGRGVNQQIIVTLTKKDTKYLTRGMLKMLSASEHDVRRKLNSNKAKRWLFGKLKKAYKLNTNDYTTSVRFFDDIAKMLKKIGYDLAHIREAEPYQNMYKGLLHLELELPINIKPPNFDLLNRAYRLSYGLQSYILFMMLTSRKYEHQIPEEYLKYRDLFIENIDHIYTKTLVQVKMTIIKSYIQELKV